MKTNATEHDLMQALQKINKKYSENIKFNRFEYKCGKINFTLKVCDYKKDGHSIGFPQKFKDKYPENPDRIIQKRLSYACWHVHGDFFDALFEINPKAVVWSRGNKITRDYGNWEDYNVGSMISPMQASERCDCVER